MTVVYTLCGVALILVVLLEAFEALVLPRRITRRVRFSRYYYRFGWRAWAGIADLLRPGPRRETVLSFFGPLSLLVLFAIWGIWLIVGYAMLHHVVAPRDGGLADSIYFSGVTFTTLGYGDLSPVGPVSRALSIVEAASGFGFFAIVISYLPVLYQAFGRREALIGLLDARAGSPPSAGRMLLRLPPGIGDGTILNRFLTDSEAWAAEVLEAQLSFPVLGYYRSQHDNQSWLAAMTCALDTSALLLTVAEGADRHQARLTFAMCRHVVVDLSLVLWRPPDTGPTNRLPDGRLHELLSELRKAEVKVRDDAAALTSLNELRSLYEPFVIALGHFFRLTVPDVWPNIDRPDNWQTSAWMRRAGPLTALGADPKDDHFG
jgi:Ion channel